MPRSEQQASASASFAPSPSDSRNIATEPHAVVLAERLQPVGRIQTALFPVEMTVWKPMPRRVPAR